MTAVKENSAQLCTACNFLQPSPDARLSYQNKGVVPNSSIKTARDESGLDMENLLQSNEDRSLSLIHI